MTDNERNLNIVPFLGARYLVVKKVHVQLKGSVLTKRNAGEIDINKDTLPAGRLRAFIARPNAAPG